MIIVRISLKLKVSALVSAFDSLALIEGCLNDLLNQTIYRKDLLEIIVIDGGSSQTELKLVQYYQSKYRNIVSLPSQGKETLYSSWNRGISIAKGEFITNANTDDRHHESASKSFVKHLRKPRLRPSLRKPL